jgi:beta-glucanase (GH16 family)
MEAVPRRLVLGGLLALPLAALAASVADAERKPPSTEVPTTTTTSTAYPHKPKPTGIPGRWNVVLDDDFDGPTLNTALWNTQYPWGEDNNGDGSENCYLPANVGLDGAGHLVLTGQRGEVSGTGSDGQPKTWPYSSGQVNTWGKFSLTYGALEARVQVPAGLGTWPAFWALPADGDWPPEVDVMEVYGTDPGTLDMTYHWGRAKNPKSKDHETTLPGGADFSDEFHVFGCNVTRDAITWYLDGVEQWSFTNTAKIAQLEPLYVVCNLAIGGGGGDPTGTPMPVRFVVDYIRAWEAA